MNRFNHISFELSIIDLLEELDPITLKEYEDISDNLHQHIELAISDYIDDKDAEGNLQFDKYDYSPLY